MLVVVVAAAAAGGGYCSSQCSKCLSVVWCPSSQAHKQGGRPRPNPSVDKFFSSLQPKLDRGLLSGRLSLIMPSPFPVPCVRVQARWCSAATDAGQQHPAMAARLLLACRLT
jgi:hypothetical protein